ncbi:MAG: thiamine-phosphate kinase [Nitrospirae bacterium]|nr:thiamine-phosphate kinase [Nitrospirota bacterium]
MPEELVSKWGERKLLKSIFKRFFRACPNLKVGMGDDAAIIQPRPGRNLVFTTDTLIEKIDFDFDYTTFEQAGHKAMAANLSDIAAMGAFPRYFLLSLAFPSTTSVSRILGLIRGADRLAKRNGTCLIGGDLSEAPKVTIGITLIGEVRPDHSLLRHGSHPGDTLFVTGTLGDSKAGLELLRQFGTSNPEPWRKSLFRRHLTPLPRLKEGQLLSQKKLASAMIDISDGFFIDILNLTQASDVGAEIHLDNLPLSPSLREYGKRRKVDPALVALSGGEDFELLFSVSPQKIKNMNQLIQSGKIGARSVGKITRKKGIRYLDREGNLLKLKDMGFEHFISTSKS